MSDSECAHTVPDSRIKAQKFESIFLAEPSALLDEDDRGRRRSLNFVISVAVKFL